MRSRFPLVGLACSALACAVAQQPKTPTPPSQKAGGASTPPAGAATTAPAALAAPPGGAVATGRYRNLFAELGYSPAEVKAKIEAAYRQLFRGNPESEAVFFKAGKNANGDLAYIMDVGNKDIRSEGMSYGMMIAVELDKKDDFDALWNWAKSYMFHGDSKHPCYGYFSWQMRPDGTAMDEMPAPDAEEYIVTALYFASHRWGNGKGIFDYGREASELLDRLKNREEIRGTVNQSRTTSAVALFDSRQKIVRFTPDTGNFAKNGDHTDPSYHLPAFYRLWSQWGPERDRQFWAQAATVSRDFFVRTAHPKTGLTPDYAQFDGRPKAASWDAKTADFRFDAWRTAMNWAVDAAWWGEDPREQELTDRLLAFFIGQGPNYVANYRLDGQPTVSYSSLGLKAANAVAALASRRPDAPTFAEALYRADPPTGQWRYYDGLLYMMALLHAAGEFRVFGPATAPAGSSAR